MNKLWIVIIFLCIVPLAFAEYSYTLEDQGFNDGVSIFRQSINFDTGTNTNSKVLSNGEYAPLTKDLDGDGLPEIIILDGTTIRLYQNETLDVVDAYSIPSGSAFTPLYIEDVDSDGLEDIVVVSLNNPQIGYFLEYNGTAFYQDANVSMSGSLASVEEGIVACGGGQCAYVQAGRNAISTGLTDGIQVNLFNRSSSAFNTIIGSGATGKFCFSQIPSMYYTDHNNDGVESFIFTMFQYSNAGADSYTIYIVDSDGFPDLDYSISKTAPISFANQGFGVTCENLYRNTGNAEPKARYSFTSAIVYNFDQAPSNGLEFFLGYMEDPSTFRMDSYSSAGTLLDEHPDEFFIFGDAQAEADGTRLANSFRASIFDSGGYEGCTSGFSSNGITILCASLVHSDTDVSVILNDDVEFQFNPFTTNMFNVSFAYKNWNSHTLASTMGATETATFFPSRIVTGNGIFGLSKVPLSGDILAMSFINDNPIGNGTMIIDDATNISQQDLLVLRENNIFYIDDLFVNSPAEITQYTINPCIEENIQVNTSMNVQVKVEDLNSDQVRARAIYYADSSNEIVSDWSPYASSGTTFSFTETLNVTFSNALLRIEANDRENNNTIDSIELFYSVASQGVEYGDCTTTESFTLGGDEEEDPSSVQDTGEACTSNDECDSGLCQNNICTLKPFKASCTIDDECLSGSCDNGICSKSSSWESIDSATKSFLGDDTFTLNLIAIVFILIVTGVFITATGGSAIGLLVSAFVFLITAFFFTLVGWLSAWFSISIFVFLLIAMVVIIMFRTNDG